MPLDCQDCSVLLCLRRRSVEEMAILDSVMVGTVRFDETVRTGVASVGTVVGGGDGVDILNYRDFDRRSSFFQLKFEVLTRILRI